MCTDRIVFKSCTTENCIFISRFIWAGTWIILVITNHVKHISFTSYGIFSGRSIFYLLLREVYNPKESHWKCVSRIVSWLQCHASWCCGLNVLYFPSKHCFWSTFISATQNVMSWNLALKLQTEVNTFFKIRINTSGQAIWCFNGVSRTFPVIHK